MTPNSTLESGRGASGLHRARNGHTAVVRVSSWASARRPGHVAPRSGNGGGGRPLSETLGIT